MGSKEKEATTARSLGRRSKSARRLGAELWGGKGREGKGKQEEMEQGRNGTGKEGQEVGIPREFPPGAELEEFWHTTQLWPANVSGPPKGTSPLWSKNVKPGGFCLNLYFWKDPTLYSGWSTCDLKVPCYPSLPFLWLQFSPLRFQG